jgi:hypothetical protein
MVSRTPKLACSRWPGREQLEDCLVHGKEHQVSPPDESLMAAITAQALSMAEELNKLEFVQERRKREKSEREVDVFKRGYLV